MEKVYKIAIVDHSHNDGERVSLKLLYMCSDCDKDCYDRCYRYVWHTDDGENTEVGGVTVEEAIKNAYLSWGPGWNLEFVENDDEEEALNDTSL